MGKKLYIAIGNKVADLDFSTAQLAVESKNRVITVMQQECAGTFLAEDKNKELAWAQATKNASFIRKAFTAATKQ